MKYSKQLQSAAILVSAVSALVACKPIQSASSGLYAEDSTVSIYAPVLTRRLKISGVPMADAHRSHLLPMNQKVAYATNLPDDLTYAEAQKLLKGEPLFPDQGVLGKNKQPIPARFPGSIIIQHEQTGKIAGYVNNSTSEQSMLNTLKYHASKTPGLEGKKIPTLYGSSSDSYKNFELLGVQGLTEEKAKLLDSEIYTSQLRGKVPSAIGINVNKFVTSGAGQNPVANTGNTSTGTTVKPNSSTSGAGTTTTPAKQPANSGANE